MKHRREAGMSLIELMIALGVGAVILYAVTTMLTNTGKEADSLAAKNEFNQLVSEIQTVFGNPNLCQAVFTGQFATPANQTNVPNLDKLQKVGTPSNVPVPIAIDVGNTAKGSSAVYKAGIQPAGSKLTLLNFEFTGKTLTSGSKLDAAGNPLPGSQQYEIQLHVAASRRQGGYVASTSTDTATGVVSTSLDARQSNSATGGDLLEKFLTLRVTLDGTGQHIVGCSGQNGANWLSTGLPGGSDACRHPNPTDPPCYDIVYKGRDGTGTHAVGVYFDESVALSLPGNDSTPAHNPVKLDISGQAMGVKYSYRSDIRYKKNVRAIPGALARVEQLHGVVFDWKNRENGGNDQIGFIAQEVEKSFPETVTTDAAGLKSVSYQNLVAPIVEAMKERQKILVQQDRDLAEIRRELGKR